MAYQTFIPHVTLGPLNNPVSQYTYRRPGINFTVVQVVFKTSGQIV